MVEGSIQTLSTVFLPNAATNWDAIVSGYTPREGIMPICNLNPAFFALTKVCIDEFHTPF
jgi:hypothetical protein